MGPEIGLIRGTCLTGLQHIRRAASIVFDIGNERLFGRLKNKAQRTYTLA